MWNLAALACDVHWPRSPKFGFEALACDRVGAAQPRPQEAMVNQSTLFTLVAVVLGFLGEIEGATCVDCDSAEENVLLQRAVSSHDETETALEGESWKFPKRGYSKHKDGCVEDVEATQKQ